MEPGANLEPTPSSAPPRGGASDPARLVGDVLPPLPYHREIVDYLRAGEKDLWKWFSSETFRAEHSEAVRLDLLKSTYRLEPAQHPDLYALAERAGASLGLRIPITLYQSQVATGMNASLAYLPGEGHLIVTGPVTTTLTPDEIVSVFAHELSHLLLWERAEGEYLIAQRILNAMANHPRSEPAHRQSARLFRLYEEIYADRGALFVTGDAAVTICGLVKLETGLASVSAESYVRQAEEIFARQKAKADGTTHPETFIRARALKLWADRGPASQPEIARMLEGPPALDELDLVGQKRLADQTRRLVSLLLEPAWIRSTPVLAHARLFFPDFAPPEAGARDEALFGEFENADAPLRDYVCYLLLDFASVDPDLEDLPLAAGFALADRLGLGDRLEELAGKELGLPKKQIAKVRKDSTRILSEA